MDAANGEKNECDMMPFAGAPFPLRQFIGAAAEAGFGEDLVDIIRQVL